jgi:hypothetical protein
MYRTNTTFISIFVANKQIQMKKIYISVLTALTIGLSANSQVLGILNPTFGNGGSSILSPVSPTNFDNAQDV